MGLASISERSMLGISRTTANGPGPVGRPASSCGSFREHQQILRILRRRFDSRESEPVVKLRVRSGESIQEAVRRFRKLCERSGLRKEMRRKAYYEKPSERRRREELKRLRKARQVLRV